MEPVPSELEEDSRVQSIAIILRALLSRELLTNGFVTVSLIESCAL